MSADNPGGILDPDGAMEELASWKGRIDQLAADTQEMSDRLQQLRVTARDEHGMVEVTIDTSGALTGLRLGRRIQQIEPDAVARAIMQTIGEARGVVADRSKEILADTIGLSSPAAQKIASRLDSGGDRDG
jgi:DNA-binding protein YbaB